MTDTVTIKREIEALDKEFDSAENVRTGRLTQHAYFRQHAALRERLRDTEQQEQAAKRPAQTQRSAPRRYVMPTAEVKQLREMELALEPVMDLYFE